MPDQFEASTVSDGRVHHISVNGELDLGTAPELEAELRTARATEGVSVLIDLTDCEFIDSSGLALIVAAWRDLSQKDGDELLALCCASDQVERLLRITGAYESMPIFEDADEALEALQEPH